MIESGCGLGDGEAGAALGAADAALDGAGAAGLGLGTGVATDPEQADTASATTSASLLLHTAECMRTSSRWSRLTGEEPRSANSPRHDSSLQSSVNLFLDDVVLGRVDEARRARDGLPRHAITNPGRSHRISDPRPR